MDDNRPVPVPVPVPASAPDVLRAVKLEEEDEFTYGRRSGRSELELPGTPKTTASLFLVLTLSRAVRFEVGLSALAPEFVGGVSTIVSKWSENGLTVESAGREFPVFLGTSVLSPYSYGSSVPPPTITSMLIVAWSTPALSNTRIVMGMLPLSLYCKRES